jgi:hypothetical protein
MHKHTMICVATVVGLSVLTGCRQKSAQDPETPGPAERAGAALDKKAEEVRDLTDRAVERTGAALEKAGTAMQKSATEMQE